MKWIKSIKLQVNLQTSFTKLEKLIYYLLLFLVIALNLLLSSNLIVINIIPLSLIPSN
jgi:cell division protein FtsL